MNLQGWQYFVVGRDASIEKTMDEGGACRVSGPNKAQIVIFSGGTDVGTLYYNEEPLPETQRPDDHRDRLETAIYRACLAKKKFLVGICRGAQLLNVLNGGRLWQHVDGHRNCTHPLVYVNEKDDKLIVPVTSDHHQMMKPTSDAQIWGSAGRSAFKKSENAYQSMPQKHSLDPEIVYYRATRSLCYQPHPEWGLAADKYLFFDCIRRMTRGLN